MAGKAVFSLAIHSFQVSQPPATSLTFIRRYFAGFVPRSDCLSQIFLPQVRSLTENLHVIIFLVLVVILIFRFGWCTGNCEGRLRCYHSSRMCGKWSKRMAQKDNIVYVSTGTRQGSLPLITIVYWTSLLLHWFGAKR